MDDPLRPGHLYRHFKGGVYRLVMIGTNSETLEPMAIYTSLETNESWVRPVASWKELVQWPDRETRQRFTLEEELPPPTEDFTLKLSDQAIQELVERARQ